MTKADVDALRKGKMLAEQEADAGAARVRELEATDRETRAVGIDAVPKRIAADPARSRQAVGRSVANFIGWPTGLQALYSIPRKKRRRLEISEALETTVVARGVPDRSGHWAELVLQSAERPL